MEFNNVWERTLNHQGEIFYTVTKIPFTYQVNGNSVVPDHTKYPINKSQFIKVYEMKDIQRPGQISNIIRGSAYVFAILTDDRIAGCASNVKNIFV